MRGSWASDRAIATAAQGNCGNNASACCQLWTRIALPKDSLPPAASDTHGGLIRDTSGTADSVDERVWAALVLLGGFESEVSFILADQQEVIRARSERAFAHLQRSIVADPDFREKWLKAFKDGEVACEKLGGAHLLLHGIFAFKITAEGERTDLVFQDIAGLADEKRYADGIVLTEWKIVRSEKGSRKPIC